MEDEDGRSVCDVCEGRLEDLQLTLDGQEMCLECVVDITNRVRAVTRHPEARDDGR